MTFQAGVISKWTNDSQCFLLEHFDTIQNSPSHIYHSALPLSPSSSWLRKCYSAELPLMVKVVKGLPAEWGECSRTVLLNSSPWALSCHNNSVAVGCEHRDIIILNAITGSQLAVLSGHTKGITSLMFSSNGSSLVSGSYDYTVKLWDIQTGGVVKTFFGHTDSVWSVSISTDCTRIASGSHDKTIHLWDTQTGECYHTIQQQSDVSCVCFSPTVLQHLSFICSDKVWQCDTNSHQIKPPFNGVSIAFSSDGTQFVSCYKGVATVQNSDSGETVTELQVANSYISCCCFSPDGRLVAGAANSAAYIWNITDSVPHLVGTFVGHTKYITSLAFSSPSSLISASYDRLVRFWQIGALLIDPVVTDLNITSAPIQFIALQVKDGITITSDSDGMVEIWDIFTGLCKASHQTPAKGTSYIDAQLIDGKLICVWYTSERVHMWDTEKGELWEGDRTFQVSDLKISGDRSKIFCLDIDSIQAYSIQTGKLAGRVKYKRRLGHKSLVVDDSRVWVHSLGLGYEGWDFGVPGSLPVQLHDIPLHGLHPSGVILWDTRLSRMKDQATGKMVFQLSGRFKKPVNVQWNGQHLVLCYTYKEALILDFTHLLLV